MCISILKAHVSPLLLPIPIYFLLQSDGTLPTLSLSLHHIGRHRTGSQARRVHPFIRSHRTSSRWLRAPERSKYARRSFAWSSGYGVAFARHYAAASAPERLTAWPKAGLFLDSGGGGTSVRHLLRVAGMDPSQGDAAATAGTGLRSSSCFAVSSVVKELRAIAEAVAGRFALKLQPAMVV